jgi:hypothetical protein
MQVTWGGIAPPKFAWMKIAVIEMSAKKPNFETGTSRIQASIVTATQNTPYDVFDNYESSEE